MKYNLYYKGNRINYRPLSEETIQTIASMNKPIKKIWDNKVEEIPLNKIRVVKCTIV